jgi:hypothetical protein
MDREYRQDQEQAEHAQRENGRQGGASALFVAAHGVWSGGKHGSQTFFQNIKYRRE